MLHGSPRAAALYKGDERTRTIDIYVDGVIVTTWTSSGTTSDFETVTLGVTGSTIELRGVLGNSEFLSILEVSFASGSALIPYSHRCGCRRLIYLL